MHLVLRNDTQPSLHLTWVSCNKKTKRKKKKRCWWITSNSGAWNLHLSIAGLINAIPLYPFQWGHDVCVVVSVCFEKRLLCLHLRLHSLFCWWCTFRKSLSIKSGMRSMTYPSHASDIGVWHPPVFDLHTKAHLQFSSWNKLLLHVTCVCFTFLQSVSMCWLTLWTRVKFSSLEKETWLFFGWVRTTYVFLLLNMLIFFFALFLSVH